MQKPPLFERALLSVAPTWAAGRAKGRREFMQHEAATAVLRKYEAASTGRRTDGWNRPATSARAEVSVSAAMLRNGARQLVRDNGHAANALNVLESNVIGTGIRPRFVGVSDQQERLIKELWESHCESETSGAEEIGNFYDRQSLGFRTIVESGSVLARRRRRNTGLGYQVQLLEPDYLCTWKDGDLGRNFIQDGKEYDKRGNLVAVHIYITHPGDSFTGMLTNSNSVRVPVSEIAHAFRMDRPGQSNGASWFAPVMNALRDHADTRDAYQLRQKIAACYTAFIHDNDPIGTTSSDGTVTTDAMEPGRIESLAGGKTISFANPPGVDGMSDFDRDQLRTIAVGMGIPYEELSGDLSNVSFLSGRMGRLAFYKNIDKWRQRLVIPRLCNTEMTWFLQSVSMLRIPTDRVRIEWTAPHRDLLDPVNEIKALREEMRLGALSYPDMVAMRGRDARKVLDDIEKSIRDVESRNLLFDWDASKMSLAGNVNTQTTTGE